MARLTCSRKGSFLPVCIEPTIPHMVMVFFPSALPPPGWGTASEASGVIAGQSWSAYLDRDCNRVEKSNVQYSKRNLALGGPPSGQVWVVGSAGIRYFEERVCFTISYPAANLQLPQTSLKMIRRCLAGSRPLPTPLSAGERVLSELFETSELEQFKRN